MTSKREDAQRKRDNAIKRLRSLGMSDKEIAAELGLETLEARNVQTDSAMPVDSDGIIDAEIVSVVEHPSTDQAMDSGSEPLAHLPAVIAQPDDRASQQDSIKVRQWTEEWWAQTKPEVRQRRCKAHRKDGGQCLKAAINGATVCRYHGGAAKHVKAAARARIENAQDLMAKALLRMAVDDNVADAVKLSAIKDALDRGGLRAPTEVVLSPGQQPGYEEVFDGIYSGDREASRAGRTRSVDGQQDSTGFEYPDSADYPPAPAMPADHPEQASTYTRDPDSDRLAERERQVRRSDRESQRSGRQNWSEGYTDAEVFGMVNEENARAHADPPPPRRLRALPPGRTGY
jgi:hypothetical protein